MSWFCLLLSLILCSAYTSAQFTVTQDASVSSSLGESVRITCSRSGGSVTGSNYPAWYYQTPGSPPKLLIYSGSSSNQNSRPSGISDRFSGSISGVSAVLSISKVESLDEGFYHCCLYAGSNVHTIISADYEQAQIPHACPLLNARDSSAVLYYFIAKRF
ncbi:unnamed protein product [Ranitomeya imitator]|uniref:Ig-like domain-containing protein n=1 Tax=Ranitomeya imitator TaxID=111125 RepID=A0ABN9LGJ9_9NEOB|nr:unnamed protein product [Ranitomeya imitator]